MSGPFILPNGDVVSSALSVHDAPKSAVEDMRSSFRLERGQITHIYTVDDSNNQIYEGAKGYLTLYDVRITRQDGSSEVIPRCQMLQPGFGGGINNFMEVIPTDPSFDAKDLTKHQDLKRGHYVLVGFIGGVKSTPVILGALPHINPRAIATRPTKDKGTFTQLEIQGLNVSVGNEGQLKVTFNGPRKDDGSLVNENGPTELQIDATGNVKVSTNAQQSVAIDRTAKTITVTNGSTSIKLDQEAKKIQVVGDVVEIGTGDLQPQLVGNDWKSLMSELITEISNIIVPTGVGPSGTPVNAAKFMSIKSKLENCLSTKHMVEKG